MCAPQLTRFAPCQSHDNTVKLWEIGYLREEAGTEAAAEDGAGAASDDDDEDDSDDSDSEDKGKGKKRKPEKQAKPMSFQGGKKGKPGKGGARDPDFFKGLM
jgi:hypothetical protein